MENKYEYDYRKEQRPDEAANALSPAILRK